ncbi:neutral zinc metallopeptidase [Chitinophaga pendula]|uniref:KPN_02809 family neutral zinc metallopeptidase n=1 Tax=Chitinophaga TaxID=79328 RepID=UPI000BAFBB12|nr:MULTISPECIES: neutral zinc metallopeptidase [Chitinophaga]ASZ12949.1 metalloprotease [Chitinophaga sp. MD30]UCJ09421.1 neutral zinc metallopeptidase [Chitinophaga pendula]
MRWQDKRLSDNVEDRRGGGGGMRTLGIGGGIGGIIIVVLALLFNQDPKQVQQVIQQAQQQTGAGSGPSKSVTAASDEQARFISTVLASTEDVWTDQFRKLNQQYSAPKLVLFSDLDESGCGSAQAAMGPFYCPADQKVYLDLSFFREMEERFNAAGDFAQAYVIAHEVGHHVQNLLGISRKVQAMRARMSETAYNRMSVKLELQADFLAGVWAHHAQQMENILEPGDIEEALRAASAVGDDKLQQASQGRVVPDAFTHGTSAQRMRWFKKGFDTGDINQGDTFASDNL